MMPADPSPLALLWRAFWRTTLAGALIGAGYGALVLGLSEASSPGAGGSALDLLGRVGSAALGGGYFGLVFGGLTGLVGGLALGVAAAVTWRRTTPPPARARLLGLAVGLLPAALLVLAMTGGSLRDLSLTRPDSLFFVVLPVALGLSWMGFEAGALARWRQARSRRLPG